MRARAQLARTKRQAPEHTRLRFCHIKANRGFYEGGRHTGYTTASLRAAACVAAQRISEGQGTDASLEPDRPDSLVVRVALVLLRRDQFLAVAFFLRDLIPRFRPTAQRFSSARTNGVIDIRPDLRRSHPFECPLGNPKRTPYTGRTKGLSSVSGAPAAPERPSRRGVAAPAGGGWAWTRTGGDVGVPHGDGEGAAASQCGQTSGG